MSRLKNAIKTLHSRKDKAYGAAWKRRGEQVSILPNVARKVDRLTAFVEQGTELLDESIADTAIDLSVYCLKYLLFLAEQDGSLVQRLALTHPSAPLSDREENFDQLVESAGYDQPEGASIKELIVEAAQAFESLWPMAADGASLDERFAGAQRLCRISIRLVARVRIERTDAIEKLIQGELGSENWSSQ